MLVLAIFLTHRDTITVRECPVDNDFTEHFISPMLIVCVHAQWCPTLCDPINCSLFLCPWDYPSKNTGSPFPPPGDLPDPGIKPRCPVSPAMQVDSLPTEPPTLCSRMHNDF